MTRTHLKTFTMAYEALTAAGFRGLADKLDATRADYVAKCVALDAAKRVMDQHARPKCDKHPDDDPVQCGWKRAYSDMLDALWTGW